METTMHQHIDWVQGKCGGKPCIRGTRIRVWDIYVEFEQLGQTVEEILVGYPGITRADVYAALAYYYDHQAEIEAQMKAADESIERMKKDAGSSLLQQKFADLDRDAGSDCVRS